MSKSVGPWLNNRQTASDRVLAYCIDINGLRIIGTIPVAGRQIAFPSIVGPELI